MKLTPNSFFPGIFKEINLNDFLKEHNLLDNDPDKVQRALDAERKGCFTFGGYGENRKDMFQTTYLAKEQKFTHLGIDINVPFGTQIKSPFVTCDIVDIFVDKDQDVGWGTRLIIQVPDCNWLLVLGHLVNDSEEYWKDIWPFYKGETLGRVGTYPSNGNVFEHLHIQAIKWENINDFDGYGHESDLKDNPNPFEVEWP